MKYSLSTEEEEIYRNTEEIYSEVPGEPTWHPSLYEKKAVGKVIFGKTLQMKEKVIPLSQESLRKIRKIGKILKSKNEGKIISSAILLAEYVAVRKKQGWKVILYGSKDEKEELSLNVS